MFFLLQDRDEEVLYHHSKRIIPNQIMRSRNFDLDKLLGIYAYRSDPSMQIIFRIKVFLELSGPQDHGGRLSLSHLRTPGHGRLGSKSLQLNVRMDSYCCSIFTRSLDNPPIIRLLQFYTAWHEFTGIAGRRRREGVRCVIKRCPPVVTLPAFG